MLLIWILKPIFAGAQWVLDLLPRVDYAGIAAFVNPFGRLLSWVLQLNAAFPVVELLAGMALLMVVFVALYGVMLVRRIFSLIWPGAGS